MFDFLGGRKARSAASELASQFTKHLPVVMVQERRGSLSVNKLTHQIELLYEHAIDLRNRYRMGFFGKTIMINDFQWELKRRGYPEDFIDIIVEGLILRLNSKK